MKKCEVRWRRPKLRRHVPSEHVAWVTETGGITELSSPVVSDGIVVIGMSDRGNREECGVSAFDAASGKMLWHFKTDTAVKGSVAIGNDRVFAVSQSGTLFILGIKDGNIDFEDWAEVGVPALGSFQSFAGRRYDLPWQPHLLCGDQCKQLRR